MKLKTLLLAGLLSAIGLAPALAQNLAITGNATIGGTLAVTGVVTNGTVPTLPAAKFTTAAKAAGTLAVGDITGANFSVLTNTGATPGAQTVRTAAQMLADIPGAVSGTVVMFRIVNTGAGTLTLTADGGATVTITGTATIATNIFRDYTLTFTSATAATIQSVGSGVSP